MIDLADYILLGTITKTHGIKGQVVLLLHNLSYDNIIKMESVLIEIDGLPVPFFIEEVEEKAPNTLLLKFEDLRSEESAKELTSCRLFISKNMIRVDDKPGNIYQLSLLTGYTVVDKESGNIGKLMDILDIEMNPLLRILNKRREILIPFQPEFITGIDKKNNILYISAPSGLIKLF